MFPAGNAEGDPTERRLPVLRVALICAAIALLSCAGVLPGPAVKDTLIAAAVGAFVIMLRIDRAATAPLLPSDAFSLRSPAGAGLWMVLLLSVAYSPLAIYVPLFLQRLHGLEPLPAGYMVAAAPLAWTGAALTVASFAEEWPRRLIVAGPIAMSVSLLGVAALIAPGPVAGLLPPIALIGIGIGASWAFIAQRVMSGAKDSEETVAAASLATVQQAGIALGTAIAGLVANASGIGAGLHLDSIRRAAFWVPLVFVAAPVVACALCIRSNSVTGRSGRTSALAANKGSNLGRP